MATKPPTSYIGGSSLKICVPVLVESWIWSHIFLKFHPEKYQWDTPFVSGSSCCFLTGPRDPRSGAGRISFSNPIRFRGAHLSWAEHVGWELISVPHVLYISTQKLHKKGKFFRDSSGHRLRMPLSHFSGATTCAFTPLARVVTTTGALRCEAKQKCHRFQGIWEANYSIL